ncbi:uncharacterized protein METZ01_LOCUS289464 [marine metagenome]|uniref:Uncharacterized protein n=1 Tax=marine metagenome TaxID=408172 RepID=A0A382LJ03_9ZZZZ
MTLTLIGSAHDGAGEGAIEILSGIDATYDEYQFHFYNICPVNDGIDWQFQVDTGTNENWNMYITSVAWQSWNKEGGASDDAEYNATDTQANADNAYQNLTGTIGSDSYEAMSGVLHLYAPASDAFLKQFHSRIIGREENYARDFWRSGMIGTNSYTAGSGETTAITRIRFRFESCNIDTGVVKMFGVK